MAKSPPRYSIAFNEHSVHENLKGLRQQVADLPDDLLEKAQEHDPQSALARLEPVLEYVGALLASADTALVTPQMLEWLNTPIQQISSALSPLKDNQEFEQQVPNVQAGVDGLLGAAMQVAGAIGVWAKTDEKKAAALLGEAATEKTHQLQQQASDLQGQLDRLREEAGQASESVKTTSQERLDELNVQLNTLKDEADAERAKVQGTIDNLAEQFNSEEKNRGTRFEEIQKELTDKADEAIEESKVAAANSMGNEEKRADAAIAELEGRTSEIMGFLEEKKQEAIDMVDTEATSSTAGAFKSEAEEQRHQADLWRFFAISGGGIAVLVALAAVALAVENIGSGASMIVAKVTAVTLLLGIAGYAAGQSGQHRRREQRARRLYMQMVAFKPFSEPLPDPEKKEVRKEFIERMFVGDPGEDHKGDDVKMSDENLSVLLKFVDIVRSPPSSSV
jgi:hypothetical protein